ncbi:MAG TPA: hypothetical protein VJV79_20440, partial [Polyangiaceae bacterium]|nr:hypothetical protein [Polyangiaceae bacterium]
MKSRYWAGLGLGVVAAIASCSDEPLKCGPGTTREGDECVIPTDRQSTAGASNSDGKGPITNGNGDAAGSAGDHADTGAGGDRDWSGGAGG